MEIEADRRAADAEAADQDALDEILRRGRGERGVEGHDDGAVEPGRRRAAAACRARWRAGTAGPAGGRTCADAARRSAPPPCGRAPGARARGVDHRAVAAMHAVEIADRHHRAAQRAGLRRRGTTVKALTAAVGSVIGGWELNSRRFRRPAQLCESCRRFGAGIRLPRG